MIAQLTGSVAARADTACVIDVNGVGYLVQASSRTLAAMPPPPAPLTLLTEMQVREDAITLFGFAAAEERDWFRLLTGVQGVGGRVALNVLSALSPAELTAAIARGDKAALGRASGVGPKLAARLAMELRDKAPPVPAGATPAHADGLGASVLVAQTRAAAGDALSALINLGYRRAEAEAAVAAVCRRLGADATVDALIRDALRDLAR